MYSPWDIEHPNKNLQEIDTGRQTESETDTETIYEDSGSRPVSPNRKSSQENSSHESEESVMGNPDEDPSQPKKTENEATTSAIVDIIQEAANTQKEKLEEMTNEIATIFKSIHEDIKRDHEKTRKKKKKKSSRKHDSDSDSDNYQDPTRLIRERDPHASSSFSRGSFNREAYYGGASRYDPPTSYSAYGAFDERPTESDRPFQFGRRRSRSPSPTPRYPYYSVLSGGKHGIEGPVDTGGPGGPSDPDDTDPKKSRKKDSDRKKRRKKKTDPEDGGGDGGPGGPSDPGDGDGGRRRWKFRRE